jgi:antitoxin component YwqK of YwqJK toxin-antitoxin module
MKLFRLIIIILSLLFYFSCTTEIKKEFYNNGNIKAELPINHGKLDGIAKYYYQNGVLEKEVSYVNGLKQGITKDYLSNGNLVFEVEYKDDLYNGYFKEYSKDGVLESESFFVNDVQQGLSKNFFSNGKIKSTTTVVDGKFEGEFHEFFPNGKLKMLAVFDDDTNVYYRLYNQDGSLQKVHRLVTIKSDKDTLVIGDTYNAIINVYGPISYGIINTKLFNDLLNTENTLPVMKIINGSALLQYKVNNKNVGKNYLKMEIIINGDDKSYYGADPFIVLLK